MDPIDAALAAVGVVGATIFLPPLKEVYSADPNEPGTLGQHMYDGVISFTAVMIGIGLLQSIKAKNAIPFIVAGTVAALVAYVYLHGFATNPASGEVEDLEVSPS